jgi:hypothetical protein
MKTGRTRKNLWMAGEPVPVSDILAPPILPLAPAALDVTVDVPPSELPIAGRDTNGTG